MQASARPSPKPRPSEPCQRACSNLLVLNEKVSALETWREHTEADLQEIREVIAQVKLLITLSIGGGGLSVITLVLTITRLLQP